MPTNHLNSLVALTFVGLAGMTGSAAAQFSSQFDLDGDVATPGVYNYASLSAALPATTEKVTYMAGPSTVMDTFTGTGLWTLLQSAGGVKPIPGVKKNSSLLNYVVAVGSDGYQRFSPAARSTRCSAAAPKRRIWSPIPTRTANSAQIAQMDSRAWSRPAIRPADAMCPISLNSMSVRRRSRLQARAACPPNSR